MTTGNRELTIRIGGRLDGAIRDLDRLEGKLPGVARSASQAERGWRRAAVSIRDFATAGLAANAAFAALQRVFSGVGGTARGVVEAGLSMGRPRERGVLRRSRRGERTCYASRMSTTSARNAMTAAHRIAMAMAAATMPSKPPRIISHTRLQKLGSLGSMHARVSQTMTGSNTDLTIRIRGQLDGAVRDLDRLESKLSGVARSVSRAERGWRRGAVSIRDFGAAIRSVVEAGLSMERPREHGVLRRGRRGERTCYASRMSTTSARNAMPAAHRIAAKMAPANRPSKQPRTTSHTRLQKFGSLGSMHARVS